MIRFYLEIDSILFDQNIVPKSGSSQLRLDPNIWTMFFDSMKEKKEKKEKKGEPVPSRRGLMRTIKNVENYRALILLVGFPYKTRIKGKKGRILDSNGRIKATC